MRIFLDINFQLLKAILILKVIVS